jgi:coenzyme F420-0:L-glutamate ligase/coenzyme F420-1:gamma-L-glutamate ligase
MTERTSPATPPVTLTPLLGLPEVQEGDNVAILVLKALQHNGITLIDGDVLVVSSKIVSKAMGLSASSARQTDVVLSQTVRVVAERTTASGVTRIVESVAGPVMTAAGVDASNTADESIVLTLPDDPDAVAAEILRGVQSGWATHSGDHLRLGVVLSDTAGRPWRIGQTDFALGAAGIQVLDDLRGSRDANGRVLSVTERCVADEIAAAADLVKGKADGIPAAHLRGLSRYVLGIESASGAKELVRTGPGDWFSFGAAEAVRAALGIEPGSAAASEVGIPSIEPEHAAKRAGRALRVALLTCPEASGQVEGDAIVLMAADEFTLGIAVARTEVALHGERLPAAISRTATPALATAKEPTVRPSARVVFR